jgi:hypothetical protein
MPLTLHAATHCSSFYAGSKAADKRRKDGPAAARPAPAAAPRWYVTGAELASVPSYIKGRLTLEKVGDNVTRQEYMRGHCKCVSCSCGVSCILSWLQVPAQRHRSVLVC